SPPGFANLPRPAPGIDGPGRTGRLPPPFAWAGLGTRPAPRSPPAFPGAARTRERRMARRRLARRARRALLWWATGFAASRLALPSAGARGRRAVRAPESPAKLPRLRARRAEAPGRPLVLILGSSRTKLALQAGRLGTATDGPQALTFNFGLSGCGPMLELV